MYSLTSLKLQKSAFIRLIENEMDFKIRRRLYELGFVEGAKLSLIGKSVFGKTFLVYLRGYKISLRKDIAEKIFVESQME